MPSASGSEEHLPYFFLSYAHTPRHKPEDKNPDMWVEKLYHELCREVLQHTSLPSGARPGFMDIEIPPGAEWDRRLAEELATCRVFVPLYSRRYFRSEQCGKEWAAFDLRRRNNVEGRQGLPEVIVPAFWIPVPDYELPDMVKSIQFTHPDLGTHYVERGFYGMMKIKRFRDHYKSAVDALAHRIIEVAEGVRLPASEPCDYAAIKSAFNRDEQRKFQITIVAHTAESRPVYRHDRYYGGSPLDWNPYLPSSDRSIAETASEIVRELGFEPDVGTFADHRDELINVASPSCPGLVLVDPWVATDQHHRQLLRELDQANKPWVGLVIPWNETDVQLADAATDLRDELRTTLPRKIAQGRLASRKAVHGIHTLGEFETSLRPVVQELGSAYLRHVQTFPPEMSGTEHPSKPSIQDDQQGQRGMT
ncbi:hypothetical protein Pth03_30010 [Planotetraspora thailandica]|uniref:TIR domain-containing protein n=1 Tax=Planotetraspora thailandica TaxID=487172 RepID=A0A8J3V307_9ACTN|nr:hypothetical protein Pth03_30010 [Planotetraspora thailandica]